MQAFLNLIAVSFAVLYALSMLALACGVMADARTLRNASARLRLYRTGYTQAAMLTVAWAAAYAVAVIFTISYNA